MMNICDKSQHLEKNNQKKFQSSIICYSYNQIGNIRIISIGCELSIYDSITIAQRFNQDEKIFIIDTCAVTQSAKDISDDIVNKISLIFDDYQLYVTGCGIDFKKNKYNQTNISQYTNKQKYYLNANYTNITDIYNSNNFVYTDNKRECLIKIQDGCNNNCSYCIIPKLKHDIKFSTDIKSIFKQIESAIANQIFRIKLIGTEITKYEYNGITLSKLVDIILNKYKQIQLISFNAFDPANIETKKIIEKIKINNRLNHMIELSVQAGSDNVLVNMNRSYTVNDIKKLHKLGSDIVNFSWHLIVGFPTETEQDFNDTLTLIDQLRPAQISIHPYSRRDGTIASKKYKDLPSDVLNDRVFKLEITLYKLNIKKEHYVKTKYLNDYNELLISFNDIIMNNNCLNNQLFIDVCKQIRNNQLIQRFIFFKYDLFANLYELEIMLNIFNSIFNKKIILIIDINNDNKTQFFEKNIFNKLFSLSALLFFNVNDSLSLDDIILIIDLLSKRNYPCDILKMSANYFNNKKLKNMLN